MKNNSFIKNILAGVNKKIKSLWNNPYKKVNLNLLLIKYLKHITANKIHSHQLLNHKTFFYSGPQYLHGLKEIFVDGVYDQAFPQNAYILDCGAHIGISVIYLKNICPTAHIVCFEPDAKNFDLLQKNISSTDKIERCIFFVIGKIIFSDKYIPENTNQKVVMLLGSKN